MTDSLKHWRVERDMEKCSLCEVCTRCCPTGALSPEEQGDTLRILFRPELCDGCGKCCLNKLEDEEGTVALTGPELRTIFLGFDQMRDELIYSNINVHKHGFRFGKIGRPVCPGVRPGDQHRVLWLPFGGKADGRRMIG